MNNNKHPHSIAGIISFSTGITYLVTTFANLGYAIYLKNATSNEHLIIGLVAILGFILGLVGIYTGVFATFARGKNKIFAIIGITINTTILVMMSGVILAGLSTK